MSLRFTPQKFTLVWASVLSMLHLELAKQSSNVNLATTLIASMTLGVWLSSNLHFCQREFGKLLVSGERRRDGWCSMLISLSVGIPTSEVFRSMYITDERLFIHSDSFIDMVMQPIQKFIDLLTANRYKKWVQYNVLIQIFFDILIYVAFGHHTLFYMILSTYCSFLEVHPLSKPWYITVSDYDEWKNLLSMNAYHVTEKRAFPGLPWMKLPMVLPNK